MDNATHDRRGDVNTPDHVTWTEVIHDPGGRRISPDPHDVRHEQRVQELQLGTAPEPTWRSTASVEYRIWELFNDKWMPRHQTARCGPHFVAAAWVWARRANGVELAVLRCLHCGSVITNKKYSSAVHGRIPKWSDGVDTTPCERCGDTGGVELHHWAPRSLFDDADLWPVSNLCRPCHQQWHGIVTPRLSSRKAS